jgi:hypothetical protein
MAVIECGRFKLIDGTTLEGPGEYVAERGNDLVDRILAGEDVIFNGTADHSPSVEMAILVRLQTDYAGWVGSRQLHNGMDGRRVQA